MTACIQVSGAPIDSAKITPSHRIKVRIVTYGQRKDCSNKVAIGKASAYTCDLIRKTRRD